jgi:hypothetical protein
MPLCFSDVITRGMTDGLGGCDGDLGLFSVGLLISTRARAEDATFGVNGSTLWTGFLLVCHIG